MKIQHNTFLAGDKKNVHYYQWSPEDRSDVRAIVQIAHGMAEHAGRYGRFASFLVENGFAVFANDHRGHGKTAGIPEQVGYFENGNFWESAILDMHTLGEIATTKYPGKPRFLIGHSMGSLLARDYISRHGNELGGVLLSATGGDPGLLGLIGLLIARVEALFKGRKNPSPLLNSLSFGKFNQPFKPNRTDFDWLSRDENEVDKYVADPLCGTVFTTGFFIDLIKGVHKINSFKTYSATPRHLPIMLMAGDKDPVGDMGKGVTQVFNFYKNNGLENVILKLYKECRHEILNETNREEVFEDVLDWLELIIE